MWKHFAALAGFTLTLLPTQAALAMDDRAFVDKTHATVHAAIVEGDFDAAADALLRAWKRQAKEASRASGMAWPWYGAKALRDEMHERITKRLDKLANGAQSHQAIDGLIRSMTTRDAGARALAQHYGFKSLGGYLPFEVREPELRVVPPPLRVRTQAQQGEIEVVASKLRLLAEVGEQANRVIDRFLAGG
jgi:hypothetical protein